MKATYLIIASLLLLGGMRVSAQTKMIAHLSHSGSIESFDASGVDNFGLAPRHIDSVLRLTDTSAIEFSNYGRDTVTNPAYGNNWKIISDSLRRQFPNVKFVGFEKKKRHAELEGGCRHGSWTFTACGGHHGMLHLGLLTAAIVSVLACCLWRAERNRKA
jgi:hypothetical protein